MNYVPYEELERLRALPAGPARTSAFADACRINVLYMVGRAGSGHLGTSLSCLDILAWLHLDVLGPEDRYFSSKGHDAPALYAVLIGLGRLDFDLVHRLRRLDGLPGHPDVVLTPQVHTSTGSLGMGISKAKGFVRAQRLKGTPASRVFVVLGDGELQEGQLWESLISAANERFEEITALVDHNKLQSDTWVQCVSDLGDLEAKVRAFGWEIERCDGHDPEALGRTLELLDRREQRKPRMVIADTLKGSGVSFMQPADLAPDPSSLYAFHSGAPDADTLGRAVEEVHQRLTRRLEALGQPPVQLVQSRLAAPAPAPARPERLVTAYGAALVAEAQHEPRLIALDADLVKDTGLVPFRERFPERFVECGIAEQDMVSQAGALALEGLLPVVHSFACFLSTRANEQIYNNATEATKVIYVGSLAGLLPGGPGHSHQSVRDVSALGAMPGMALLEPCSEHETALALSWAVREAPGPVYLRLVSVPWELPFEPPAADRLQLGRGQVIREGADAVLVGAGPVMVSQGWQAAQLLAGEGIDASVVALPWLRAIDGEWLADLAGDSPVYCLDNHYLSGGQGDAVLVALAEARRDGGAQVHRLGVESVPACGANDEVLRAHRLDAPAIAQRVGVELSSRV